MTDESESLSLSVKLQLKCPCGAIVLIADDEDGASILHRMPMCEHYDKLEPDEYLRWVRGVLEGGFDA